MILVGDCRVSMAGLAPESVQTCVTSPPYFGLRDYGMDGQIGLEETPEAYVAELVSVFRAVHRVLKKDGTVWLNLGDSYLSKARGNSPDDLGLKNSGLTNPKRQAMVARPPAESSARRNRASIKAQLANERRFEGLKPKDLIGIPWRVAFALQAEGWYLRSDIIEEVEFYCPCGCGHTMEERVWRWSQDRDLIWKKPNPMPESVTDRPTKAHEYLFLLTKSPRYYYDADAIAEPATSAKEILWAGDGSSIVQGAENGTGTSTRRFKTRSSGNLERQLADGGDGKRPADHLGSNIPWEGGITRNRRSVWTVPTKPYAGAHFATFPPALIEPCILAGSRRGDTVLDPFGGAGTTGLVAEQHGRQAILCELNPAYADLAEGRLARARAHGFQESLL